MSDPPNHQDLEWERLKVQHAWRSAQLANRIDDIADSIDELRGPPQHGPPMPTKADMPLSFSGSLRHALRAASFLVSHLFIAGVLILTIWPIHILLYAVGDPKLYDWVPLRYVFDTMDLGLALMFVIEGVSDARRAFRDHQ